MIAVTSGEFLREFTLYADRAHEEKEPFIVQRENGAHLVMMPLDAYNEMKKELYLAKKQQGSH